MVEADMASHQHACELGYHFCVILFTLGVSVQHRPRCLLQLPSDLLPPCDREANQSTRSVVSYGRRPLYLTRQVMCTSIV